MIRILEHPATLAVAFGVIVFLSTVYGLRV